MLSILFYPEENFTLSLELSFFYLLIQIQK